MSGHLNRETDRLTQAEIEGYADLSGLLQDDLVRINELTGDSNFSFTLDGVAGLAREDRDLSPADQAKPGIFKTTTAKLNERLETYASIINQAEAAQVAGQELSAADEEALELAYNNLDTAEAALPALATEKLTQPNNPNAVDRRFRGHELKASEDALAAAKQAITDGASREGAFGEAAMKIDPASVGRTSGDEEDEPLSISEKARQIRDAVQCWLLYNAQSFAEHRNDIMPTDSDKNISLPGYRSSTLSPSSGIGGQRIILTSPQSKGLGLQNRLNYRKGSRDFVNIQSHEYAQLNPTLRIFKVQRKLGYGKKMIEFDFSNTTRLDGIARALTTQNPDGQSYYAFTRGSEVGVESFEWQFLGSDPFSATRDISATLKIHAQNLAVLVERRIGTISYHDFTDTVPDPDDHLYRYIDLLVQPDCEQEYAPECFEVRVDVGYAPVEGPTVDMRDGVKRSAKNQKDTLYLVVVDHTFDIAEDGSVSVTINFQGRLETLMKTRKANILLPYGGQLQSALTLDVVGENKSFTPEEIEAEVTKIKDKKTVTGGDKKRLKNFESALADLSFQYKQIISAHILETMYSEGLVFEYDLTSPQDNTNFQLFKSYQAKLSKNQQLPPLISKTQIAKQITSLGKSDANPDPTVATEEEVQEAIEILDTQQAQFLGAVQRKIRFFYFGDLVSTVLQSVTGDNTATGKIVDRGWFKSLMTGQPRYERDSSIAAPDKKVQDLFNRFRIIFGNIDLDLGLNPYVDDKNNKLNIANVPISVDAYSAWFRSNILASDTAEYAFFDFVDDVLTDLIMDPLSSQCFNGLFDIGFRPKTSTIIAPALKVSEQPIDESFYEIDAISTTSATGAPASLPGVLSYKVLNVNQAGPDDQIFQNFGADSLSIHSLHEYLFIGAEVQDLDVLKGDEEQDAQLGIPHLHFGNAFGLMKKVTFSKSDIEYLPELRYASEGNFLYNQLANVYDVSIELVGTNIFKPGQYVYIDTTALGAGPTWAWNDTVDPPDRSWSNLMGLGGYHLVTEVAHSISRDGFSTVLKARWVGSGKRNFALQAGRFVPQS